MYSYKSLEPRQIRLCKFNATSDDDVRITCTLEHFNIDNLPQYTCLSYHWGSSEERNRIYIDNHEFLIMPNLFSFLRRYAGADERIWIDQICINQDPEQEGVESEKKHQIMMMSDIYERASQVRIWLGEPTNDSAAAFEYLRRLFHITSHGDDSVSTAAERVALVKLLNRAYWRRVWIVQELYLGCGLIICCGDESIAYGGPYNGNAQQVRSKNVLEPYKESILQDLGSGDIALELWHQACTALNLLVFCGWKAGKDRPKISLHDTMALYQKREYSIECDRVYGLLALVKEEQKVEVNYEKSTEDVYCDTVFEMAKWANTDHTGINFKVCVTAGQMAGPLGFNFAPTALSDMLDHLQVEMNDKDTSHVAFHWLLENTMCIPDASDGLKRKWVCFLLHLPYNTT